MQGQSEISGSGGMVDALVLEASTSVCGFESHLPHQKKKGTERCLFLLLPRHLAMPNAARCGGDFRFAPCVAGTCGSPTYTPVPADLNLPGSKKAPGRVPSFGLYHRLPQDSPSRIRAAERHTKTLHSSLFSLHSPRPGLPLPLPGKAREPPSAGAGNQVPGGNAGLQNALPPAQPRMPGTGSF